MRAEHGVRVRQDNRLEPQFVISNVEERSLGCQFEVWGLGLRRYTMGASIHSTNAQRFVLEKFSEAVNWTLEYKRKIKMVKSIKVELENTKLRVEHLRQVKQLLSELCPSDEVLDSTSPEVKIGNRTYEFGEDEEQEESFLERYREQCSYAQISWRNRSENLYARLHYQRFQNSSFTIVTVETRKPSDTKRIAEFIETVGATAKEEFPVDSDDKNGPRVFIGHGRSPQWKDLRDHLRDMHGFKVEAYESGARSGHSIRDVVVDMANQSDIAFLVHTAEDDMADGTQQSRPNVTHETGLFQGRLGYTRAIVLLEAGCEEFSNLAGVQQIRFKKGSIRETFGDVLATIKREFGSRD